MTRRRLDLPPRRCAHVGCPHDYVPVRRGQKFHSVWCRKDDWRARHSPLGRFAVAVYTDATRTGREASTIELGHL